MTDTCRSNGRRPAEKESRFLENKKEKNELNLDHTGRTMFEDMEGLADGWRRVKDRGE